MRLQGLYTKSLVAKHARDVASVSKMVTLIYTNKCVLVGVGGLVSLESIPKPLEVIIILDSVSDDWSQKVLSSKNGGC
jgi:hypothetical protein